METPPRAGSPSGPPRSGKSVKFREGTERPEGPRKGGTPEHVAFSDEMLDSGDEYEEGDVEIATEEEAY